MREYNHQKIEQKWQKQWAEKDLHKSSEDSQKPKCYVLDEFPYPSGEGLHAGHTRIYTASDVYARMKRMQGYSVLHPTGWDAFGLPAEQFAIKHKVHPSESVKKNTKRYHEQMDVLGLSYDWGREINTTDPAYYKWTQWAFLKMLEKGLAYESFEPINWCRTCQTGLANEDLDGENCERCETPVERKPMRQWVIRITEYADRLVDDLELLSEWPEAIKEQQRNWIGRSEGAEIQFPVSSFQFPVNSEYRDIKVFTTRPDTLFGATYIAISAELAKQWLDVGWKADKSVREFIEKTLKDEATRARDVVPEKEGIATGIFAENPANREKIPVWIANYVLSGYGTGAIMAVPAHDERDFEFAKKYDLPIKEVVIQNIIDKRNPPREGKKVVERKNVHAIVKDPRTGKYLALKWNKFDWVTFPMGGREEGEDAVEAAMREVKEETGFTNLKLVKVLEGEVRAEYFAAHKDENRISFTTAVVFDLVDHTQSERAEEEKDNHNIIWLDESQLNYQHMTHAEVKAWRDKLDNPPHAYTEEGVLLNSKQFDGKTSAEAKALITTYAGGKMKTIYKLKDWVFSRQRYWGEPIPVVHCAKDGVVPVPESELPVMLPKVKSYAPTGTGESPLADILEWVNTACPKCGGPAKRETNTMPQWAGSSWYYLRFMDPKNSTALVGKEKEKYWTPVDMYVGGAEHVTRHLIYARFWHKFLYDIGVVSTVEPFKKRKGVGLVLVEGGGKMSKRRGNVINPDDMIEKFGADSLRVYVMFMGPFGQAIAWSTDNLIGARRFIERFWRMQEKVAKSVVVAKETELLLHQTTKKVSGDIEQFAFNTAISQLMIFLNHLEKLDQVPDVVFKQLVLLIAPLAPHIAEELWHKMGNDASVHTSPWPTFDEQKTRSAVQKIAIQVSGKLRGTMEIARDLSQKEAQEEALSRPEIKKWLTEKTLKKVIYIPGRTINFVVE